jgi:hypothetical protein
MKLREAGSDGCKEAIAQSFGHGKKFEATNHQDCLYVIELSTPGARSDVWLCLAYFARASRVRLVHTPKRV